jgi:hypothetical protein
MDNDLNDSEEELKHSQEDMKIILTAMQSQKLDLTFVRRLKTIEEQS